MPARAGFLINRLVGADAAWNAPPKRCRGCEGRGVAVCTMTIQPVGSEIGHSHVLQPPVAAKAFRATVGLAGAEAGRTR